MKSLSIKMPMAVAQHMDDRAELNPSYISAIISESLQDFKKADMPAGLYYGYVLKISDDLHKAIKLAATMNDMSISDFVCQLIITRYKEVH